LSCTCPGGWACCSSCATTDRRSWTRYSSFHRGWDSLRSFTQSSAISDAIYSFRWYEKESSMQKYVILILLRSQKALTLKACGLKVMSLATFLGVECDLECCFLLICMFSGFVLGLFVLYVALETEAVGRFLKMASL
jgi:hypothetical protein